MSIFNQGTMSKSAVLFRNFILPVLIFICASLIFAFPVLRKFSYLGNGDWDQFTFWNAVPRETILKFHQFPLWNPYVNGGNVLLAHPDSPFFSPFYFCVLLFGPIAGLKIEIIIHLIVGMLGMFLLAKHLGMDKNSDYPCYLAAFVYMLSAIFALRLTEGQTEWLALAFVPLAFLYYLKSFVKFKNIFGAVLFLTFMLFSGVYVFNIFVVFLTVYVVLQACQLRRFLPIKILLFILGGTFLLGAIKIIPLLEFLNQCPRITNEISGTTFSILRKALFGREQAFFDLVQWDSVSVEGRDVHGWHEYGAYIGIVPILLFFYGIIKKYKEHGPLLITGLIFLLIAMGDKSPIFFWCLLHKFPIYNSLTVPSRFMFCVVFVVALFAGFGFSFLEDIFLRVPKKKNINWFRLAGIILVLFIFVDLIAVNSQIFNHAFGIHPQEIIKNIVFSQRYQSVNLYKGERISRSSLYPIFLTNSGILDGYEVVAIQQGNLKIASDDGYQGEAYLAGSNGTLSLNYFSPNKIIISADLKGADNIVLNQNYYTGWKVEKGGMIFPAKSYDGLISIPVMPGDRKITFYYLPTTFLIGLVITGSFLLFVAAGYFFQKRAVINKKY